VRFLAGRAPAWSHSFLGPLTTFLQSRAGTKPAFSLFAKGGRMMTKQILPEDWREQIAVASKEEILELLPLVERFAAAEPGASLAILTLLQRDDFAVRLRTFLSLSRMAQPEAAGPLLDFIADGFEQHWRLCALDALSFIPIEHKAQALGPHLADNDGIFVRGLICLLGQQKEEALPYLVDFLEYPHSGKIRSELLGEALWQAAEGREELLAELRKEKPAFNLWDRHRLRPPDLIRHYEIFPYPDYLWQKAKKVGMDQKAFKRLYYWSRDKNGK